MATSELQICSRSDSAADWTSNDPILGSGEWGYESDTGRVKILGYMVLNITTGETVFAAGNGDSDVWDHYDGTTAHTPV